MQIFPQELEGQPDIVEVVGIDLAAEHHAHDMETPATIDRDTDDEAAACVAIPHAHHPRGARPPHPIPLPTALRQRGLAHHIPPYMARQQSSTPSGGQMAKHIEPPP